MSVLVPGAIFGQISSWSQSAVALETDTSSWVRMTRLADASWLAAYTVWPAPTRLRIKRSFDSMRTWQFVAEISEPGRNLDNANLFTSADGTVLLAMRSVVNGQSYRINVYSSVDYGNSFGYTSTVDSSENTRGSQTDGVYEPFLSALPDGALACFYANEKHSTERPSFSQTISERVSNDGGQSWGYEIRAVAQAGAPRPGEPNLVALNGGFSLFYEVCGSEQCGGHTSWSADGVSWDGTIGPGIPETFQNPQALMTAGGILIATSNEHSILTNDSGTGWRDTGTQAFSYGSWPGLYQTSDAEIALVMTGAGDQGQAGAYIRFGEMIAAHRRRLPQSPAQGSR